MRLQHRHGPGVEIHRPATPVRLRLPELHVVVMKGVEASCRSSPIWQLGTRASRDA
jgi:hypothetical protein